MNLAARVRLLESRWRDAWCHDLLHNIFRACLQDDANDALFHRGFLSVGNRWFKGIGSTGADPPGKAAGQYSKGPLVRQARAAGR